MHTLYPLGSQCDLIVGAIRCLSLLFIPTKTKSAEGDIPYMMRYVPVSVPVFIGIIIYYSVYS